MVDERQPGTTTARGQSIRMMAAAQLTVLAIALRPGHQKLLPTLAARMALLQDLRLPHMAETMAGAPRRLLTRATVVARTMNGAAIPLQAAGLMAASKLTMLLPLAFTSRPPRPQH